MASASGGHEQTRTLRSFGEGLQAAAWGEIVVGSVTAVGAVLAILVVRDITSILRNAPSQTSVRPS